MDVVIPIVFPDYRILVEVAERKVDLIPGAEFDNFRIPGYRDHVSQLGHAGVLFIEGKTGLTKYYEYGRYDAPQNLGIVRPRSIPDAVSKAGKINAVSLKRPLAAISQLAGNGGRIQAAYIEVNNKFGVMLSHAKQRESERTDPKRKPYDLLSKSCLHFMKEIAERGGVSMPAVIDPRPNAYIARVRSSFLDLDFSGNSLAIEGHGTF
jgi:hypothetical protein